MLRHFAPLSENESIKRRVIRASVATVQVVQDDYLPRLRTVDLVLAVKTDKRRRDAAPEDKRVLGTGTRRSVTVVMPAVCFSRHDARSCLFDFGMKLLGTPRSPRLSRVEWIVERHQSPSTGKAREVFTNFPRFEVLEEVREITDRLVRPEDDVGFIHGFRCSLRAVSLQCPWVCSCCPSDGPAFDESDVPPELAGQSTQHGEAAP